MFNKKFIYPQKKSYASLIEKLANSKIILSLRRSIFSKLPFLKLTSVATDIIYLNWVIDVNLIRAYIPENVVLYEKMIHKLLIKLSIRPKIFLDIWESKLN